MAQPDYELDDFTAVSEWERFTANVEECLREWSPGSTMSPSTSQQQLQSPWSDWLVRACDLGTLGGQRFELVRHWHESTLNERVLSPSATEKYSSDGNVFLDLLDARCDFDSTPSPEPYRLYGFRDFAVLRIRQNSTSQVFLSIQLSNILLSSLSSAASSACCSMPLLLEMPSSMAGMTGRVGYTGISVSRVALVDLNATVFNPPSRPPTHLSTAATGHLCYWIAVMRNHLQCPLWPQPPIQLSVRYSFYVRLQFPQYDLSSPSLTRGGSADDEDEEASLYSEEIDSEEDYEDGFMHSQQGVHRRRSRRRRSSGSWIESVCSNFCRLPLGIYDPSEAALEVSLTWPILDDSHFTDSPVVSATSSSNDLMAGVASCRGCTLDPATAVDWSAKLWLEKQDFNAKWNQTSRCILSDFLSSFSKIAAVNPNSSSNTSINTSSEASSPASSSRGSGHWGVRLVKQLATATASAAQAAQTAPNFLPELMRYLIDSFVFPKADVENNSNPLSGQSQTVVDVEVRDLKAAPADGLVERIAIVACNLYAGYGQTAAVQFWQLVCNKIQGAWESGKPLPKMDSAIPPDLKQSLIAQKFQLLAYCLGQRLRREREVANASSAHASRADGDNETRSDGRLRMLDPVNKTMLKSGKDIIYVPETQEPEPLTEDELPSFFIESDVEPTSGVGFQHSIPCLLSDMSSFKAANPGAELIDFLRWYSPRDVQTNADGSATLSSRMCIPDNIWHSTWEKAKPIPARRQKRLFDETRAAHSVLRWFSALGNSPRDLTLQLLPVLMGAALRRVLREAKGVMPAANVAQHVPTSRHIKEAIEGASEAVVRATSALSTYALAKAHSSNETSGRSTPMEFDPAGNSPSTAASNAMNFAFEALSVAEQRVCLISTLRSKLSGAISAGDGPVLDEFLFTLLANCSAPCNGTPFPGPGKSPTIRGIILSIISSEAPSPQSVSAVIRANCPRPAAFSRSLPHRLYVRFQPNSSTPSCSHMAAAFSRDIVFA